MAKTRRRAHRRKNPTGTLLVNPGRGGKRRTSRRKGFSLRSLLGGGRRRRNPLLVSNPRRSAKRHTKRRAHGRRRNPLLMNPLLVSNPKRRGHGRRRTSPRRHNPLILSNPAAGVLGRYQRGAQNMLGKLPLVGGVLAGAIGVLGSTITGAIGVYPIAYALPYIDDYIPAVLKPVSYSLSGVILSGIIKVLPRFPYQNELSIGVAAAGGAVDAFRAHSGMSQSVGDVGETGDAAEMGEIGDEGGELCAWEYGDADLGDAEYSGADLSAVEIGAAELGRKHYYKQFRKYKGSGGGDGGGSMSDHAGKPGLRWAWLIYWIGFENFQRLAALPEQERRSAIEKMKLNAALFSRRLLNGGEPTTVQQAEMSGLLVA